MNKLLSVLLILVTFLYFVCCGEKIEQTTFSQLFQDEMFSEIEIKALQSLSLYKINNKDELEFIKIIDKNSAVILLAENSHRIESETLYLRAPLKTRIFMILEKSNPVFIRVCKY